MLGLPTETDEDVLAIADLSRKVVDLWYKTAKSRARPLKLTVSTSFFVPKPHTAFQWEAQITPEEYKRRVELLRSALHHKLITYNWHSPETSVIEAVLARGDRRLGKVLERVCDSGGRLEAWDEYFSYQRWQDAIAAEHLDIDFYANRLRDVSELLPWDVVSSGVSKEFFISELRTSHEGKITPDCKVSCSACGASELCSGNCVCDR